MAVGKRQRRTGVELPEALADDLQQLAEQNGVTLASLCYHWLAFAVWLASHERGYLLPQEHRAPPGTLRGDRRVVLFKQGADEHRRWKEAIEGAGSSIPAVLRAAGLAYVACDGDLARMSWPPRSGIFCVARLA